MEEKLKIVNQVVSDLLKQVGVEAKIEVVDKDEGFSITLETDENALLIGKHGNTLSSIQTIISLMVAKRLGEFKRIILEIGDYRKERESYLMDLASRIKQDVLTTGFNKNIKGLKSWERRLIHLFFKDDTEVVTQSEGEGRDRTLVIKKI